MTTRRRPRGEYTRRRRRPDRASPSSLPWLAAGLLAVAVAVVVVIAVIASGDGDAKDAAASGSTPAGERSAAPAPAVPAAPLPAATPGKAPDRPAPAIDAARLEQAERHYELAKDKTNEAKRLTSATEKEAANVAAREAWTELGKLRDVLEEYTDWLEEADLGGWAIPAEYEALRRRLSRYDRLKVHVKKMPKADRR